MDTLDLSGPLHRGARKNINSHNKHGISNGSINFTFRFFFGETVLKQTEYIMSTVQKSHDLI